MDDRQPIFNAPGSVVFILALIGAVHAVRLFLPEETDDWMILALAFIPARYSGLASELPGGDWSAMASPVTHMFVHVDTAHLLLNGAWLLAFGGVIARRIGGARFGALSLACGLGGIFLFWLLNQGLIAPVIGASGAISGLMGATMRFLFSAVDRGGLWLLRDDPRGAPLMPLGQALTDRRVVGTTIAFIALNVLALHGLGGVTSGGAIAWEAHIGGYFTGLLCFGFFDAAPRNEPDRQPFGA